MIARSCSISGALLVPQKDQYLRDNRKANNIWDDDDDDDGEAAEETRTIMANKYGA